MDFLLVLEQTLNGFQFGVFLFLVSAGLTLVFGIMSLVNLAHGSLYMIGAFFGATFFQETGSWYLAVLLTVPCTLIVGVALEVISLRTFYSRDHLDQVLATFGLILFFNEAVRLIWGPASQRLQMPDSLSGHVEIIAGAPYPVFRLAIIGVGLVVAVFLFLLITTRASAC